MELKSVLNIALYCWCRQVLVYTCLLYVYLLPKRSFKDHESSKIIFFRPTTTVLNEHKSNAALCEEDNHLCSLDTLAPRFLLTIYIFAVIELRWQRAGELQQGTPDIIYVACVKITHVCKLVKIVKNSFGNNDRSCISDYHAATGSNFTLCLTSKIVHLTPPSYLGLHLSSFKNFHLQLMWTPYRLINFRGLSHSPQYLDPKPVY